MWAEGKFVERKCIRSQEASNVIDSLKVEVIFKITYPIESWNSESSFILSLVLAFLCNNIVLDL